jgi:hypothetical protein
MIFVQESILRFEIFYESDDKKTDLQRFLSVILESIITPGFAVFDNFDLDAIFSGFVCHCLISNSTGENDNLALTVAASGETQ